MKIVLAGSVSFSERTLAALIRHRADVAGVLGLAESASANVSDYANLATLAREAGIPYRDFVKINAPEVVQQVRQWSPDVLFVVGLSQLVGEELMRIPRLGSVGFHPTRLPAGRGRAPVAWLTHDGQDGSATFFVLENDADAGAIFVQEPFSVREDAYAMDTLVAVRDAIGRALDAWLPRLIAGEWQPVPQDETRASWWGKRGPEDGWIDWSLPARDIVRLVRTASRPYPGAYTYYRDRKMLVWRASESDARYRGVVGRILDNRGPLLVQSGSGIVAIEEFELEGAKPAVGVKLGYAVEDEIFALKKRIAALESPSS
jgi:methionyl-tRNA formyltransferase